MAGYTNRPYIGQDVFLNGSTLYLDSHVHIFLENWIGNKPSQADQTP